MISRMQAEQCPIYGSLNDQVCVDRGSRPRSRDPIFFIYRYLIRRTENRICKSQSLQLP